MTTRISAGVGDHPCYLTFFITMIPITVKLQYFLYLFNIMHPKPSFTLFCKQINDLEMIQLDSNLLLYSLLFITRQTAHWDVNHKCI